MYFSCLIDDHRNTTRDPFPSRHEFDTPWFRYTYEVLSADTPNDDPTVFLPRENNHEYYLTDGGDRFFVTSNEGAQNFRLLEAPVDSTAKDSWTEVVAHRDDALIDDVGYQPTTPVEVGIERFVDWYKDYYRIPDTAHNEP